jgi:hypothetical protein
MQEKSLTKEQHDLYISTRFKKTAQEREQLKVAKAAWKKFKPNDKTKG